MKRFWKKPLFDLLDKLKVTLDGIYGEGKVSLIDATLRWMYHHSQMDGAHGGTHSLSRLSAFLHLYKIQYQITVECLIYPDTCQVLLSLNYLPSGVII